MKQSIKQKRYGLVLLVAVSITAGTPSTYAADDEIVQLTTPQNWVEAGVGFVPDANNRFGQYRGLNKDGAYPLLNFDFTKLNKEDAIVSRLTGSNLGLDSRELTYEYGKQGDWRMNLDYNQIPRQETFGITTAVTGIGTADLTSPGTAATGTDQVLKILRTRTGVSYSKNLANHLDLQIHARNEDKDGSRIFARGTTGTTGGFGNFQFTPEPINSTTQQLETILGYTGDKLQLSSGYYLSAYRNDFSALNVTETAATGLASFSPIGLPPDSQAQQLYVAGGYSHSAKTRSTFKLSYGQATQNDTFILASLPGNTSLDGQVDTVQAQYGVSTKWTPKLTLLTDFRYMDRNDKTPIRQYMTAPGGTGTYNGNYEPRSVTTANAKVEGNYKMADDLRLITGVDYEAIKRPVQSWLTGALGSVAVREQTDETTLRVTLRRIMSEKLNGSATYSYGIRRGSDYTPLVLYGGGAGSNDMAPLHLANRDRHKLRLSGDWTASEQWSVHMLADHMLDSYSSSRNVGPVSGRATNVSLDAAYRMSDDLNFSMWAARNETASEQTTGPVGSEWSAALGVVGNAVGVGLRGKPAPKWQIGADAQYIEDLGTYGISPTAANLPTDSKYQVTRLALFGKYEVRKNMGIRMDYAYELWNIDDWTWTNWTYLDGTKVFEQPSKGIQHVGVSLYFKL